MEKCNHQCSSNCRREGCNCLCGEWHFDGEVEPTTAKQFLACTYAGLTLDSWDAYNHQLEWIGIREQFQTAKAFMRDENFPENHPNYPVKQF